MIYCVKTNPSHVVEYTDTENAIRTVKICCQQNSQKFQKNVTI